MKKESFDFMKAAARKREIGKDLEELADQLEAVKKIEDVQEREKKQTEIHERSIDLRTELDVINMQVSAAQANLAADSQKRDEPLSKNAILREMLNDIRLGKRQEREISLGVLNSGDQNNITSSGAINLTINDLLPRLSEGLIWDKVGIKVQTGVVGNLLWPYATDNVKIVEVGETVQLQDQKINFDNIKAEPGEVGATLSVTFAALEDSSFDLLAFIQESFRLAQQDFLNHKTFSHAQFTGIKGPWSGKAKTDALVGSYANILAKKADMINRGVNMNGFCYVMDASAEALLKSTPKAKGQGGFIIQDGKLDGDPYYVSHYIREKANGGLDENMFLGFGVWSYLAANQHGNVYMTVDPYTLADKGMLKLTLRTRWSLTTLRDEAFDLYKLTPAPAELEVVVGND